MSRILPFRNVQEPGEHVEDPAVRPLQLTHVLLLLAALRTLLLGRRAAVGIEVVRRVWHQEVAEDERRPVEVPRLDDVLELPQRELLAGAPRLDGAFTGFERG